MGPERAVECDADFLGTDGRLLSFIRAGPVAANRLIEGEHGMGAKVVVRFSTFETVELYVRGTQGEGGCQMFHKCLGIQMPKGSRNPQVFVENRLEIAVQNGSGNTFSVLKFRDSFLQ